MFFWCKMHFLNEQLCPLFVTQTAEAYFHWLFTYAAFKCEVFLSEASSEGCWIPESHFWFKKSLIHGLLQERILRKYHNMLTLIQPIVQCWRIVGWICGLTWYSSVHIMYVRLHSSCPFLDLTYWISRYGTQSHLWECKLVLAEIPAYICVSELDSARSSWR